MRRDFKTGIMIGAGLAIIAFLVLSVLPGESVESRLRNRATIKSEPVVGIPAVSRPVDAETPIQPEPKPAKDPPAETMRPAIPARKVHRIHVVAPGQTLSSIAMDYYGNTDWSKIGQANPEATADPGRLKVGTRLIIPD